MGTAVVAVTNAVTAVNVTDETATVAPATVTGTGGLGLWTGLANVKTDYGAKGDGSTDDTTAIQSALTQAAAGTQVFFPAGNYAITAQLTVSKRLWLCGQGATITEKTAVTGTGTGGGLILLTTGSDGAVVSGLTCQGAETEAGFSGSATKNYSFVYVNGVNRCRIERCDVFNKTYGVYLNTSLYSAVRDCYFQGFITNPNDVGFNYNAGVFTVSCSELRLTGNQTLKCSNGFVVGTSTNCTVANNTCVLLCDYGVYLSGSTRCVVSGNSFDQVNALGGGGVQVDGARNTIVGNTISNVVGGSGITIRYGVDDGTGFTAFGNVILGNTIRTVDRYGISLGQDATSGLYPRDCVIAHNTIDTVGTSSGGSYAGIIIAGPGHRITGNHLTNVSANALAAIYVNGTALAPCPGTVIDGNGLRTASGAGILSLYQTSGSVSGNALDAITGNGIELKNATDVRVMGNRGSNIVFNASSPCTSCMAWGNESTYGGDATNLWAQGVEHQSGVNAKHLTLTTAAKTSSYTLTDADVTVSGSAGSGAVTLTLPDATTRAGRLYILSKTDTSANVVTVGTTGSQTIGGAGSAATTWLLRSIGQAITVKSNGANWEVVAQSESAGNAVTVTGGTFTVRDYDSTIFLDGTAATVTATLPAPASSRGKLYRFLATNVAHTVTINPNGTEKINGASSLVLTTQYQAAVLQNDGTNWFMMAS